MSNVHSTALSILLLAVAVISALAGIALWARNRSTRRRTYMVGTPTVAAATANPAAAIQNQSISGNAGQNVYQAGRDVNVGTATTAVSRLAWDVRPGGPQFRMNPGIYQGRLLCEFTIQAAQQPGGVKGRWLGAGTTSDWVEPMRENRPGKYQMKPVQMNPKPPTDEAIFEVKFFLEDGEHGGRWRWPIVQHPKGHWILESHKGSNVFQPQDVW